MRGGFAIHCPALGPHYDSILFAQSLLAATSSIQVSSWQSLTFNAILSYRERTAFAVIGVG